MRLHLRALPKLKLLFGCVLFLIFFLPYQSCTKIDTEDHLSQKSQSKIDVTQRFFTLPSNASFALLRVAAEMKKQNKEQEFVNSFAKHNGYPVWNKADITMSTSASSIMGSTAFGDTLIILPLVAEGENYVNGFISIRLNGNVYMDLFRGGDYSIYTFNDVPTDSVNADKAAMQIIRLNNDVFGYTHFKVSDNRLFSTNNTIDLSIPGRIIRFKGEDSSSQTNVIVTITDCIEILNCATGNFTNQTGSNTVPEPCGTVIGSFCTTYTFEIPTGGGPTGGGTPTGGGGNPSPPTFPCPSSQSRGIPVPVCSGPIPIPPIIPILNDDDLLPCDPFISMMQSNTAFVDKVNELNMINSNIQVEMGYKVDNFATGSYTPKNGITNAKAIDFTVQNGELISGLMHTHYNGLAPIFSPQDIVFFAQVFLTNSARDPQNLFFTLGNSNGNSYMVKVGDTANFRIFANKIAGDDIKIREFRAKYNASLSNGNANLEIEFLKMMKESNTNGGFEIYSGNTAGNEWSRMRLTGSSTALPGSPNAYSVYLKNCY